MDWTAFLDGFGVVTQPTNLLYCLIGVLIGMLIGVLPGLGPAATMAILLPIAYNASDPVSAIIMLAGIYYGAQYGGTITSVLLRIPGEASSITTTSSASSAMSGMIGRSRKRFRHVAPERHAPAWTAALIGDSSAAPPGCRRSRPRSGSRRPGRRGRRTARARRVGTGAKRPLRQRASRRSEGE